MSLTRRPSFQRLYAKLACGQTIEQIYQKAKRDKDGRPYQKAKGQLPAYLIINGKLETHTNELRYLLYTMLWHVYFMENLDLWEIANGGYDGFRDLFAHNGKVYTPTYSFDYRMTYSDLGCNQAQSIAWLVGRRGHFCNDEPLLIKSLERYWQRTHGEQYPIGHH